MSRFYISDKTVVELYKDFFGTDADVENLLETLSCATDDGVTMREFSFFVISKGYSFFSFKDWVAEMNGLSMDNVTQRLMSVW